MTIFVKSNKNVMTVVNSFIIILLTGFGSYIAYQQYKLNKQVAFTNSQKVKWDLFDKRYKIYLQAKNILLTITTNNSIENEKLRDFNFETRERVFLFDDDINKYINSIIEKGIDITASEKKMKIQSNIMSIDTEEWHTLCKENSELTRFFSSEYQENIENRFLKYLDFRKLL